MALPNLSANLDMALDQDLSAALEDPDGGGGEGGSDMPMFTMQQVASEQLTLTSAHRLLSVAAANSSLLVGCHGGEVIRWFPAEEETAAIDFGRENCVDISRVLLEPKGFHALISSTGGDSWYINYQNNQAKSLPKLKGHLIEAVSWDPYSTDTSTKDLVLATRGGHLLHVVIEGKEKQVRTIFVFDSKGPLCGVYRERVSTQEGAERLALFVATGSCLYAFIGNSLETIFQRYQGEGAAAKALVYEVPLATPHGELHVDDHTCNPATKVLFWLTGVGVLAADIRDPLPPDNAVLESPPGIIPFPRAPSKKASPVRGGESLVAALLPPPPPLPPLSMALTPHHLVFIFEDRWAVVSRITHEVVQQQDWAISTHGPLRSIARDLHGEQLWLCSERHLFELVAEAEDRNAWSLYLRMGRFEEASAACKPAQRAQRARVAVGHADWLFRRGRLEEAARKFAEAPSVPFEHVALRFLRVGHKAALLEYFRCRLRLCPEDTVTRSLLSVWAAEFALANLHDLRLAAQAAGARPESQEALKKAKAQLRDLLWDFRSLEVHATIYHLLQSHGCPQELTRFAEDRGDYDTVIFHHISRCDYKAAVQKLGDFHADGKSVGAGGGDSTKLLYRFAPVLFGAEPAALVQLLLRRELARVDPLALVPALYQPSASALHRAEALRYFDYVMRQHPSLVGQAPVPATAPAAAGAADPAAPVATAAGGRSSTALLDDAEDGAAPGERCWTTGTAILNACGVLYSCEGEGGEPCGPDGVSPEETLLSFFAAQEGNALFDPLFALKVCRERKLMRAVVRLYALMGMHKEAVDAALQRSDVALAKVNACKPADKKLRKKLWLKIVEHQAVLGDVQAILSLIRESQELTVRDVLPYMSDSITIDAFQAEICECLDNYEGQILTLRQEMDDHRRALSVFKEDLKQAEQRCVIIPEDKVCEICGGPAMKERFYVFACGHCFREACLRGLVISTLSEERRERLFSLEAIRVQYQAAAAGAIPNSAAAGGPAGKQPSLAEVEDELDGLLADDCPLCGRLMIQTISRPFIDLPVEQAEVDSWAIA